MNNKISVIVPIYNVDSLLEKCIESIINQSYKNLQIILVDDGSTDKSGKICDSYTKIDDRIIVIHQQNQGLVAARKAGLNIADGEYIGFVDGDDYIDTDMYGELIREILKTDVDFVHAGCYYNGDIKADYLYEVVELKDNRIRMFKEALSMERIYPAIWSKLFKAEIIKNAYLKVPNNASYGEDLVCLCEVLGIANRVLLLNKAYYHYNTREFSISNARGNDKLDKEVELYLNVKKVINKYVPMYSLEEDLQKYLKIHMIIGLEKMISKHWGIQKFFMANSYVTSNKRVVIYGAGEVGQDFYKETSMYQDCTIVAWIDAKKKSISDRICIQRVDVLKELIYDIIIVAVYEEKTAKEIQDYLITLGIDEKKIYWEKPLKIL